MPNVHSRQCQLCDQTMPNVQTMPIMQSDNAKYADNANCAIRQCQICTQCQLCNQTIPNMHTMPIMQSDNAKYACNANCVSQTMPIMQTMPIVLLDNVNRATRQCHNRQWTMPNMHTMQIVQHIWHWIAAYLALTDSKLSWHREFVI